MHRSFLSGIMAASIFLALGITGSKVANAADEDRGKKAYKRCASCHTLTDKNLIGPGLEGLFGRKAGSVATYKYTDDFKALGEKGIIWNDASFVAFMQGTHAFIEKSLGTDKIKTKKLKFGLDKEQAEDLLIYLKKATRKEGS